MATDPLATRPDPTALRDRSDPMPRNGTYAENESGERVVIRKPGISMDLAELFDR